MIKWPITYTDYNGEVVTEDFYFNLNKAELIQMQFKANGSYSSYIQNIVTTRNFSALGEEFRNLILSAYGRKSDDGRRFIKSKELRDEFEQSEAYVSLYVDLINNTDNMNRFVQGVLPADIREASINAGSNALTPSM